VLLVLVLLLLLFLCCRWVKQQGRAAHRELLDRVASYIQQGVLLPPQ
jgi:hypothetical protein